MHLIFIQNHLKKKRNSSYDELLVSYKKILLSSNFSLAAGESYLFCPSPVHIQSSLFPTHPPLSFTGKKNNSKVIQVEAKDSQQRRTKRLKRLGLDSTTPTTTSNKRQKNNESTHTSMNSITETDDIQYLNLWVPTTSLFPQWSHLHVSTGFEDNPRKISGLSEIHCAVSSIRPVLIS